MRRLFPIAASALLTACANGATLDRPTGAASGFTVQPIAGGYLVTAQGSSFRCSGQTGRASRRLLEDTLTDGLKRSGGVPEVASEAGFSCR